MSTADQREKFARSILHFEARYEDGHLAVYELPAGDGGGTYEVAGINERYHPVEAARLAGLIRARRFDEAEREAIDFIAKFTDGAALWTGVPAIECYLRDCAFSRGPYGAARILQRAVGVRDDGVIGPLSKAAIAAGERDPATLLAAMRAAREQYERDVVGRDETSKFWKGLVNRWNKAMDFARTFITASAVPAETVDSAARLPAQAGNGHVHPPGVTCEACGQGHAERAKPLVNRWEPTSHLSSRNGTRIDQIIVHYTTSRNIEGTISWFKHGTPRTSAHYIVGQDGSLVQMVNDGDRAWHAGNSLTNARSIGIEHAAAVGDAITPAQANTSAALIAWLMQEYDIARDAVLPHCCIHATSCCGDLFKVFGGGAGKSCDVQRQALQGWMASMGI